MNITPNLSEDGVTAATAVIMGFCKETARDPGPGIAGFVDRALRKQWMLTFDLRSEHRYTHKVQLVPRDEDGNVVRIYTLEDGNGPVLDLPNTETLSAAVIRALGGALPQ